jgi:iron complex outermembrane receptor protein
MTRASHVATRGALLASIGISGLLASPALAQSVQQTTEEADEQPPSPEATVAADDEGQDSATGTIIVTARRTEETLQRVPTAISAFNERALDRIQATDSTGLQGAVPNLNIVQGRGSSNATNIFIRGIGQPDALQTFDPAVGVYVDDVYLSRIRGTQLDLLDLERIEVLRGPQGTLYGKNTIGGAIKAVTRRPGDELRANASVTLGSYNQRELKAAASGPLGDGIAAGLSFLRSKRDGYVQDRVLDRDYNDKDTFAIRAALALTPSDRIRIDFTADYTKDDAAMTVGQPLNSITYLLSGVVHLALPTNPDPDDYDWTGRTSPGLPNSTKMTHKGLAMTAAVDLTDAMTLRSITAYRELSTDDYVDIDATELEVGDVLVQVDQNQLSQELQLNYNAGPIQAVGGLYYLREHVTSHQEAYADELVDLRPFRSPGCLPILCLSDALLGPSNFPTSFRSVDDDLTTKSYAAYANASYEIAAGLRLAVGARYTHENKDYFRTTTLTSNSPIIILSNPASPFIFDAKQSWNDFSPMASIDYQVAPDVMVYGRVAKGFKSGGFNGRANSVAERTAYEPETVTSYEAGVKSTIAKQLRLNLTAFYNDYKDFQARVSESEVVGGITIPQLTVRNAGKLTIKGAEVEAAWTPVAGLLLDTQIGYLDAKYKEFYDERFPGSSRAFQTPAFAPKWTVRLGGQYGFGLGSAGSITIGGQSRYRSAMALSVDNTTISTNPVLVQRISGLFSEPYWVHDARIVWENPSKQLAVGVYANNLTDKAYKTEGQDFSSIGSVRTVYYGAPRTYTLRLTARY